MPPGLVANDNNPYGPLVTFQTQGILPPSALYVAADDSLILSVRNPSIQTNLSVSIRRLSPQGEVKSELYQFNALSVNAAPALFTINPAEGFILSVTIFGAVASRGQCFCKLYIQRGAEPGQQMLGNLLIQGYVSTDDFLGYPQSSPESSLNGRGFATFIAGSVPPAGADFKVTVPLGRRWLFKSLLTQFTTNATVAARQVSLLIENAAGATVGLFPAPATQPAGTFFNYTFAPGAAPVASTTFVSTGLVGDLALPSGWSVASFTGFIQPGDQYTSAFLVVEEFIGP